MRISDWSSDVCSSDLIADMGKGEGDDLSRIAGVGQDFLIAGHRGVETDFADARSGRAIALAPDHRPVGQDEDAGGARGDRGGWRSEEHTSELQSLMRNSYAVFCLKKTRNTDKQ